MALDVVHGEEVLHGAVRKKPKQNFTTQKLESRCFGINLGCREISIQRRLNEDGMHPFSSWQLATVTCSLLWQVGNMWSRGDVSLILSQRNERTPVPFAEEPLSVAFE